ncbi:MAG: VCBS repeat-containing protein [Acidobacteria bacterium]|nr:VCBS repeat-containing protein [Acidobacteriota bacterium]
MARIGVLVSNGACGFTERRLPIESLPVVGDVNGDRWPDIVYEGTLDGGPATFVRLGRGGLEFGPPSFVERAVRPEALADANGDGHVDLLVRSTEGRDRHVRLGNGDAGFPVAGSDVFFLGPDPILFGESFQGTLRRFGDADGDGLADLVSSYGEPLIHTAYVVLYRSRGDGSFDAPRVLATQWSGPIGTTDFDGDGFVDLVRSVSATPLTLYFRRGDRLIDLKTSFAASQRWPYLADFDGLGTDALFAVDDGGRVKVASVSCSKGAHTTNISLPVWGSIEPWKLDLRITNAGETSTLVEMRDSAGTILAETFLGQGRTHVVPPRSADSEGSVARPASLTVSGLSRPDGMVVGTSVYREEANRTLFTSLVSVPGPPPEADRIVPWVREDDQRHTNLALAHLGSAGDGPVELSIEFLSTDPAQPGRASLGSVFLSQGERIQRNHLLRSAGVAARSGFLRVQRITGTAPYDVYAAVTHDSGDGSTIPGFVPAGSRSRSLVLPVITGGSYQTRLILSNPGEREAQVRIQAGPKGLGIVLTIPGEGLIELEDATAALATLGLAISPQFTGPLFLDVSGENVFIAAEVGPRAPGVPVSVLVPTVPTDETARDEAVLGNLWPKSDTRTNLAIVRADRSEGPMRVTIEHESYFGTVTIEDLEIPAAGITQIVPWGTITARIVRREGAGRFIAYAVVMDGGLPGQRSDDGYFLPMKAVR